MSLIGWLFFGLIAGGIASLLVPGPHARGGCGAGCLVNAALGILGAGVGGMLFGYLGYPVWFHFSVGSMVVAILGATIVLLIFHALADKR